MFLIIFAIVSARMNFFLIRLAFVTTILMKPPASFLQPVNFLKDNFNNESLFLQALLIPAAHAADTDTSALRYYDTCCFFIPKDKKNCEKDAQPGAWM